MKAVLLTAGYGTRLRPLTLELPKCLVSINGKPLLEYWFDLLHEAGIREILVNLHYKPELVRSYLARLPYGADIRTSFESELLGTGGTLLANRDFLKSEPCIVIHADNLSLFQASAFMAAHYRRPSHCKMTMMTFICDDPKSCGIVEIDRDGVVQEFHEKVPNPPGNLANGAVYILEGYILDYIASLGKQFIDLSIDIIPHFKSRIYTFLNDIYHRDIGTLESYMKAQREFPSIFNKRTNQGGLI